MGFREAKSKAYEPIIEPQKSGVDLNALLRALYRY